MINGEWMAVLTFMEEKNDQGCYEICRCSQCDGTYVHHRAYINPDGDYVLSAHTLQQLLEDFKYSKNFDMGSSSDEHKEAGRYFAKCRNAVLKDGMSAEESRIRTALVKKEYEPEVHEDSN